MADKNKKSKYQQGYAEGVNEGTAGPVGKVVMKVTDKLLQGTTLDRKGKEVEGYNKGREDAKEAMKYQANESMKRTTEMKKDEENRRKKMKGN